MILQVERIVFNHDQAHSDRDGLNIRLDATRAAPDFVRGMPPNPVAYALAPTNGNTLTINAQFSFPMPVNLPPGVSSVQVRAQPFDPTALLGSVDPATVAVPMAPSPPLTPMISFAVRNPVMATQGIGRYAVSWIWQVQITPGSVWIDFDRTDHVVYVTLDQPQEPWSQATDAAHQPLWPWTNVLDFACAWAQGVKPGATSATALNSAASHIEAAIRALGDRLSLPMVYDPKPEWALESGNGTVFSLTDFLQFAGGTLPSGKLARGNCTDCATAVAVFANALGCDVAMRRIEPKTALRFTTNAVVRIGDDESEADTQKFGYHDVAVRSGASDATARIHDACLLIDRDSNPFNSATADYELSQGLSRGAFAKAKSKKYRYVHRLISKNDVGDCKMELLEVPAIDALSAGTPVNISIPVLNLWNAFVEEIARLAPLPTVDLIITTNLEPFAIDGFFAYERVANPQPLSRLGDLVSASAEFHYVRTTKGDTAARDVRLRVSIGYSSTTKKAREALAWLLTESSEPPRAVRRKGKPPIGDVAFLLPGHNAGYVSRGTALARIANVGRQAMSLEPVLSTVADAFRPVNAPARAVT
jgi:hypothetical protein